MDLEPQGRLHVRIDLKWNSQGAYNIKFWHRCFKSSYKSTRFRFSGVFADFQGNRVDMRSGHRWNRQWRQWHNRERGRSRPRVQGTRRLQQAPGRDEAACPPGQRPQVHGHIPAPADILLALPRVHMVRVFNFVRFRSPGVCFLNIHTNSVRGLDHDGRGLSFGLVVSSN